MRFILASILSGGILLAPGSCLDAQDSRPPAAEFGYYVTVAVAPGQSANYERFLARIRAAAMEQGQDRPVLVYRIRLGGAGNRYMIFQPFDSYDELMARPTVQELLEAADGGEGGMGAMADAAESIRSIETRTAVLQPDFSGTPKRGSAKRFLQLVTTRIEADGAADYTAMLRSLKVAEDRRGIRSIRRSNSMGPLFHHTAEVEFDDFAERDAQPAPPALLAEEFGEVGRRTWERATAVVRDRSIELWELLPELSTLPES